MAHIICVVRKQSQAPICVARFASFESGMDTAPMKLGMTIRQLRKAAGISQNEMAARIGLEAGSSLSRKEDGTIPFTHVELEGIATMLEMTVADIYRHRDGQGGPDSRKATWEALYHALKRKGLLDTAFRLINSLFDKRAHKNRK